jgi:hypothetical protein
MVVRAGKKLQVTTIDLSGAPEQILAEVQRISEIVSEQRNVAIATRFAA